MCGAQRILGPCSVTTHPHHLRHGWCLWLALTALAALGAGARAQRPRPVCASDQINCVAEADLEDRYYAFLVNGIQIIYEFTDGDYFTMDCQPGFALDEPTLPRFEPALRVRKVRLEGCWARAGSYAAALRALNVTGPGGASPAPTYPLEMQITEIKNFNASVLADMPTLSNLSFYHTHVTTADLTLLPAGLEQLELRYTKTGRVPAAALARLPRLSELAVTEGEPVEQEALGNLSSLYLDSPATRVSLSLPDTLRTLQLTNWMPRRPEPWRSCAGLDRLVLKEAAAEALPDGWLTRCARLRTLQLLDVTKLKTLAADTLRGATALQVVQVSGSAVERLPAGLFRDTPALRVLHLSDNSELDPCPRVRDAGHDEQGLSPLRNLHNLTQLDLARTGTRRVCPDWRQLPLLERLDLSDISVTQFNYSDLRFNAAVNITVEVPIRNLYLRREDYEGVVAAPAGPTLTLELTGLLRCDCELYWAAAALRLPDSRLRETGGSCEDGCALRDVPLDELVCAVPGIVWPAGCACDARDDVTGDRVLRLNCVGAKLRRVPRFDTLNITAAEPVTLDLWLADNRIDQLVPEDLPPEITALDLRGNELRVIDAATAAALVSRADRRVWLADNPLECDCRAAAALAAMRAHPDVIRDWTNATCSNGTRLSDAESVLAQSCQNGTTMEPGNLMERLPDSTTEGVHQNTTTPALWSVPEDASTSQSPEKEVSGSKSWEVSGGAGASLALGVVAVVVLVWLAVWRRRRAARRARLPATLRLERLDAREWVYDAFVAFAHADEAVVRELVERLEGGAAPLRLCVHYRDWMPGDWIPTQIAASVRLSRRTVAVVSEAFLRSKWARAEFREAYAAGMEDGEPRLVLVLLEDPARLPLDAELRACVTGSTYVRWGDAWFWEKLQRALPAPIARPVSESPAAPPDVHPVESPAASPGTE